MTVRRRVVIIPDGRYLEIPHSAPLRLDAIEGFLPNGTPNVAMKPLIRCNPDGSLWIDGRDADTDPEIYRIDAAEEKP